MSLKSGLLAIGIAVGASSGAATGQVGLRGGDGTLFRVTEVLFASMSPIPDRTHKVLSGENDWTISKKHGVKLGALHAANPGTNWRALQIGQSLRIPVKGESSASTRVGGSHKVASGENDWTIARKYGVTTKQLHAVNPAVEWRLLQIGQRINLPGGAEDSSGIKTISTGKVKIGSSGVNVRTEPTTTASVRTKVDKGTVATVLDRQGAWYELRFRKGTVGWVRGDLLSAVAERTTTGTSHTTKTTEVASASPVNASKAAAIISTAHGMLGTRYRWGGTSRSGVDCSGFTTYVFARNGISLPRTSSEQSKIGQRVPKDELQVGDLLFFVTGRNTSRINHVGVYAGGGKFVHSSSSKHRVVVSNLGDYSDDYAGARRVSALQEKEEKVVPKAVEPPKEVSIEDLFPSRVVYGADKTGK